MCVIGVPLHFWAVPTFKSIGEALGEVRGDDDIDIDEGKVRVIIDAIKPLVFSVTAEFHSGDESTIALRYEKLYGFCRICSSLRHDQFHCPTVKKSTDKETEVQPPKPEQDPAMLSYKGAVESQGRELGGDANGNNRRQGHQVPRNRDYKEDPKALKEKLLPDRHGADKQMDLNKEESEGEKIEEMEGLSEEIDSELTGDVALTETGEQDGSEHVGDEVFAEADFDVEEDDQLMETETQEVLIESEGKERGRANKKKQGKVNGAAMGGSLKKRLVQSVVSPRKKHTVKKGSKVGEKDALPPEKAPVKHVPNQI